MVKLSDNKGIRSGEELVEEIVCTYNIYFSLLYIISCSRLSIYAKQSSRVLAI